MEEEEKDNVEECSDEKDDLMKLASLINKMKSTKAQTLGAIWLKYWNIWIENTLHAYVSGEHTSI